MKPGDHLGPYEILSPLGAGGMGEVWKARDTRLNREVAIKFSNEKFTDRFEREAKSIAALNHPNICHLYDVGENYLVMELIEGEPLKGPLPLDLALKYGAQICDALDAAHSKGITHRDLKPANILVTKQGIKLVDFGIAKQSGPLKETDATDALTRQGAIVGTLNYMSPEPLQSKEADARSDIFSFGLLLYEMLTGKRAFEGASAASVIAAILERPAPSVTEIARPALDRALKLCLEKDPEQRWQSARDLKRELEWIASSQESARTNAPARSRLWPILAATLLIGAAVTAGWFLHRPSVSAPRLRLNLEPPAGGWDHLKLSPDGTMIAFQGEKGAYIRRIDSLETRLVEQGSVEIPRAWSPDSRWLLVFANGELHKIPVAGGPAQTVATGLVSDRGAAWNSDGTILFGGRPAFRVSENGGKPAPITEGTAWYPTMLPDGRHFLFLTGNAEVTEVAINVAALDSKETRKITDANSQADPSPTGHLLFLTGTTLMSQPFDASALRVTGEAVPVASDVGLLPVSSQASFSASSSGLLLYQTGGIGRTALTWFDRSGKTQGVIDDTDFHEDVRISPDGKFLAATRRDLKTLRPGLWITDLTRGITTRLTSENDDANFPAWSPDGKRIAYNSRARDVYVVEIGSGKRGKVAQGFMAAWTPDGAAIMPSRSTQRGEPGSGEPGLFLTRLGADPKPVPYLSGQQLQPAFSPDGRWVAYASDESGEFQVYVQSFPAGHGKWQISKHGGAQPNWRHDGRELFYKELEPLGAHIVAVPVTTGTAFNPGVPKELFAVTTFGLPYIRQQYSVTPDGQRFLVNALVDVHPETILLQNWLTH
jgi:eukaryotic-like serine/threonine-protein kinase